MYCRDRIYYYMEEFHKPRRNPNNTPSFSSTLLDEIYRSIDDGKTRAKITNTGQVMPEDFRRARLVDKWMRKETMAAPALLPEVDKDTDLLFFSSTSSSSDSSGALSSSSEMEFFSTKPPAAAAAGALGLGSRPKPVRTRKNDEKSYFSDHRKEAAPLARLKKVKQPISPGGRLSAFINSLFSTTNGKKNKKYADHSKSQKTGSSSTCSSASSFSRSCLSKPEKMKDRVVQRTVRFHPISVIVDEDSRPCGHKSIHEINQSRRGKRVEEDDVSLNALRRYYSGKNEEDDSDIDDGTSDSSSDLFELDHLTLFRDSRYCEELPVYETTNFDNNNRGFIR